ncbi:hypothetical protein R5R35_001947 [Gryllus longicercus]|uniref:CHK kinase-like domain-containing protein n=1 Tax=Gryllus longicercus TaxID=2509291 RepID=A0AAN9ZE33_9ORTH
MASRRDRLDFSHAKLVVHAIARFHALSIAYSEKNPDFFAPFEEFFFCDSNRQNIELFMTPTLKEITAEVNKWEGFGEIARKLEGLQHTLMDKLLETCTVPKEFQNVLIHGDCWVNNLLFKYSEAGEPIDLRLVDLQLSRKSSPAIELLYFFFSSLQNDVRSFRYDDLLHEYYNELRHTTEELGYSGQLFSFKDLCLEMARAVTFGFYAAVSILPIVLADPDDSPDIDSIAADKENVKLFGKVYETPQFREAFEELLPYFDKCGVFD